MTYHTLTNDSGQTPERRAEEAGELLDMLADAVVRMDEKESKFVTDLNARFLQYKERTLVSVKQLFWLRDLRDRYL
jgi:hypothetical protein